MPAIVVKLLVVFSSGWIVGTGQQARSPLTVCDLIRHAHQLEGQVVAVRGVLESQEAEAEDVYFDELVANSCPGIKTKPVRIKIQSPDVHFLAEPPRSYKPDPEASRRAEATIAKALAKKGRLKRVIATIEGVVYTSKLPDVPEKPPARIYHRPYPVRLIFQTMRDVKIP